MPNFKIINNTSEITLNNKWVPATKFDSKNRLVDEKGNKVSSDYKGRQYRIIEKRERTFSGLKRFGRGLLGTVAVICTLCLGLFSKSVRNLFTKFKTNIRFAVLEKQTRFKDEQTQFKIENSKAVYVKPKPSFEGAKISEDHDRIAVSEKQTQFKIENGKAVYVNPKPSFEGAKISEDHDRIAVSEKQTQFKIGNGKVVYLEPKLLFEGAKISEDQELNFALVKTDGKQKLVPVTSALFGTEHTTYEGSALEALLKLAQNKKTKFYFNSGRHFGSPINHFLKHPNNSLVTEEEFFKFILEKDETGTPRICTLNSDSTLEVLTSIKEKNIPINLNEKTAAEETLFTLWAGKGNAKITKLILELDPSVIDQTQGQVKSAFVEAALNGSEEEADLLIDAMIKKGIVLSQEELWIQRAFKNDCAFSEEEFTQLDQELKIKIFYAANAFGNEDIVKKLKPLGMDTVPLFLPGPSILAHNMDIVTTRNVMETFLKGLRHDGLLLTTEEFNKLDRTKYINKLDQIGRIQGKNFIEKLVKKHGFKHIKVPKKIAVISEGLESISFKIAWSLELLPKVNQLQVYAERVKPVKRTLSLEEAIEFMIILEKTGYGDFWGQNFFFCEDGIYFIDTEYKDFSPTRPQFESIKSLKDCVDPKDAEKFLEEYEKRKEAYDKGKELYEAQLKEFRAAFENPFSELTAGYAKHEFTFPLASLT